MLSFPDFSEKQVLFIDAEDAKHIRLQNSNLVIENEEAEKCLQVPLAKVFALFLVGNSTFTSASLKAISENGIMVFFLNGNFRTYASFGAQTEGNTILRKAQYFLSDTASLAIAQELIMLKITNQKTLLESVRKKDEEEKNAKQQLEDLLQKVKTTETRESLLGIEGSASKAFFGAYFREMKWHGRKPRTKYDIPNTLLDVGYTLLFNFLEAHLRLYGFDLYCGVYHQFFYERKSLVCDMVEPFRCIIDRALRKAWNLQQIDEKDFQIFQHQYQLSWKHSRKYAKIFLMGIMEEKEAIFHFVQGVYRAFVKKDFQNIPAFLIHNS
jgi:CRISP-associated protein Cas1